jgi:hypothetical protein
VAFLIVFLVENRFRAGNGPFAAMLEWLVHAKTHDA